MKPVRRLSHDQRARSSGQTLVELFDHSDDNSRELVAEHLELSRLESELEDAAIAMTSVPLPSVRDVIVLLSYIGGFSRKQRSGHLLWPEVVTIDGGERPWAFAMLDHVRQSLETL